MALADHAHDSKPYRDAPGCCHSLGFARQSKHAFECAVIRLDDVVEILCGMMLDLSTAAFAL
jgi:hypothetical protein